MPTVPTTFVPQATEAGAAQIVPFEATPGQPMQNLAPEQQVKMGAAMTDVGNVMYRIGSTIQDKMNEAAAKDADTQLLTYAQQVMRGQDGYLMSRGQDAETRFAIASSALADRAQGIIDSLGNDTQKSMFRQAAARNLAVFNGQMMDHRNTEVTKWKLASSQARQEQYMGQAVDNYKFIGQRQRMPDGTEQATGPFHENVAVMLRELDEQLALNGVPTNSDVANFARRTAITQVSEGVTKRLMTDQRYQDALNFLMDQKKAGNLETKVGEDLIARVTVARDAQMADELAESIKARGSLNTRAGSGNYMQPADAEQIMQDKDGAWRYVVKPYTPIVAPADGRVVEEKDDPTYGKVVAIEFADGTVGRFAGLESKMSVALGQAISRGSAVGFAGAGPDESGMEVSPFNSFTYTLERDGRRIDPATINSLQPGVAQSTTPPAGLDEAIGMARDGIANKAVREATINNLRKLYEQDRVAEVARVDRVSTALAQQMADGSAPNPQLLSQLPPDDAAKILKHRREVSSSAIMAQIAINGPMTREQLISAYHNGQLTNQDFLSQMAIAKGIETDPSIVDSDTFKQWLFDIERSDLVNFGKDDDAKQLEVLTLKSRIEERMRQRMKSEGKLSPLQQRQVLDEVAKDTVMLSDWFDDTERLSIMMTTEEMQSNAYVRVGSELVYLNTIPSDVYVEIFGALSSEGRRPTEFDIANNWVQLGKPKGIRK